MTAAGDWYLIKDVDKIDTPALVIYPERAKANIRLLKTMIDDPRRLRPHVKTHKAKEATRLMMAAGINKFKCATIAEAEMLGMCQAEDVLLAHPLTSAKAQRFAALIRKYPNTHFSCIVDNIHAAAMISDLAVDHGIVVSVYIDLNVGMNRTGILPGKEAIQLYKDCVALKGIGVLGLHLYDGHIRHKDLQERTKACLESFAPVLAMKSALMELGYDRPTIIAGGSPTLPVYALQDDVECSPGTFIYWDKGYQDSIPEQPFLPAALVIARVVSFPGKTTLCLDLGYKAIASENGLNNRVYFLNAPDLVMVSQSEEHLVVEAGAGHLWQIGDVLYGLPIHICPTCAAYDAAFTIENGIVSGKWKMIARDRILTI